MHATPPKSNNYRWIVPQVPLTIKACLSVSIIIPFYGKLSILNIVLSTIATQTYPSHLLEIIIIEDGSPDSTTPLVQYWSRQLDIKNLRIPRQGSRRAKARNVGIQAAKGDIILSIDADIALPPTLVESHLKWFHVSDQVATFGLRRFVELPLSDDVNHFFIQEKNFFSLPDIVSASNLSGTYIDKRIAELEDFEQHPFPFNCFHGCNIAYKREDAIAVGFWNEDFNGNYGYEDIEFGYRLWQHGRYIVYVAEAGVLHIEDNIMSLGQRQKEADINRAKLYKMVPGLQEYRSRMK